MGDLQELEELGVVVEEVRGLGPARPPLGPWAAGEERREAPRGGSGGMGGIVCKLRNIEMRIIIPKNI